MLQRAPSRAEWTQTLTEEALQEVTSIEGALTLLPDVPAIYPTWKQIVHDHAVHGVKVYDAWLVAIMSVYAAVESILTFNTAAR